MPDISVDPPVPADSLPTFESLPTEIPDIVEEGQTILSGLVLSQ